MKTVDMTAKECKEREANGVVYQSVTSSSMSTDSVDMDGMVSHPNMKGKLKRRNSAHNLARQLSLRRKKQVQRLVNKNGSCNVAYSNVPMRGLDFFADIFTTLIDLKWRWLLFIFSFAYIGGWVAFTGLWYALIWFHGDIDYRMKAASNETMYEMYENWEPCVYNVDNFIGAFQFSVETQTTIGYGYRGTSEACWIAAALVVIQSVFSCLVDAVFIGMVFAKIARPKKRAATIKFSQQAVIAERDGQLCFMFRIGDIRRSHIYEAHIRGQLIGPKITEEGECIPLHTYNMDFGNDTGDDRIFLVWPIIINHVIDEKSPLYNVSAADLTENNFEIIICMEGILEQTGLVTQARTSYLPSEILWGHRFTSHLISVDKNEQFKVDYRDFNNLYPIQNMPSCSAAELDDMRATNAEQLNDFRVKSSSINSPSTKSSQLRNFQCNLTSKSSNGAFNGNGNGNGNGIGNGTIRFADEVEVEGDNKLSNSNGTAKSSEGTLSTDDSLTNGHSKTNGNGVKRLSTSSRESPV